MDRILIREIGVECIIGILPKERTTPQRVLIDIELLLDLSRAASSDDIAHTVDYKDLKNRIVDMVEASEFLLIEKLAQRIADLCLQQRLVEEVTVTLDKPDALTRARSVAVCITRGRT